MVKGLRLIVSYPIYSIDWGFIVILNFNNGLIFLIKKRSAVGLLLIFIINFMRLIEDSLGVGVSFFYSGRFYYSRF